MYWTEDVKEVAKAFAIAPAIPIAIMSLIEFPAAILIFIIGAPIAYACAIIIGIPLYVFFRKFRLYGWPYFALGGALCAIPVMSIFMTGNVPIVYNLQSISSLALIGAVGGFAFWWLYPRKKFSENRVTNLPGIILVILIGGVLSYVHVLGEIKYIDGRTLSVTHPFVSEHDTVVTIEAEGKTVEARLPKGVPYRTDCRISVAVWRELFSHRKVYSIGLYKDTPHVNHYEWLTKEAQNAISKSCS